MSGVVACLQRRRASAVAPPPPPAHPCSSAQETEGVAGPMAAWSFSVSERLPLAPLQNWLFTPECSGQMQVRGKCRI